MKKAGRTLLVGTFSGAALLLALGTYIALSGPSHADGSAAAPASTDPDSVAITDLQLKSVKVEPVSSLDFTPNSTAVGYIDFNQDRNVQVFAPYQGVIKEVFAAAGDDVRKGQLLFTIQSPDLIQAESTLISSAGLRDLTTRTLERTRQMLATQAGAQKDLEQASSDQQTAEGNYRAAREAVRIFGKSEADIDRIIATRKTDGELRVVSPFDGRVTARNAAPGLLAQPGTAPAPFTVADVSTLWMVANVSEYDLPRLHKGQPVAVSVDAYPGRVFRGTVTNIGAALDPNTHRLAVRSEIRDPQHELHPQMLATFTIQTGQPQHQVAIPAAAVVREGDGTMTVFVTRDQHHFFRRPVQLGTEQDDHYPVLSGLTAGEQVATDGALFISNALALQSH